MPDLIPRTVLFGNPERVSPRLSPNGRELAWIAPEDGVLNVFVAPLVGEAGSALRIDWTAAHAITHDRDRGIRTFVYAHDGRHILYLQDRGGDENWRVFDVDLRTGEHRDLTPFDGVQAQLLAVDKRFPDDVLLGLNRDNPELHDVYHLDLRTGELEKRDENPGFVGWVVDATMVIRGGVAPTADGGFVLLVRRTPADPFQPLLTVTQEDAMTTGPLAFSLDGTTLLALSSVGAETARLVRLDCETGAMEVLAGDDEADVTDVRLDDDTFEPQLVTVLKDRAEFFVLDPSIAEDLATIRTLHHGDPTITSANDLDTIWLVAFVDDIGPVHYFLYERSSKAGHFLFTHQPALEEYELAPMEPFSVVTRDGLRLHGYVTYPLEVDRASLPAVLNVHGGPWARDTWGYDPEAQWLANRGYCSIQVNYRGSTGYGKAFVNAGDKEWAGRMHDDLLDVLSFFAEEGIVDAKRVAIFGGSYGGYAALVGASFTPERFACAVDIVGPSNLKTLIESIPPYWAPDIELFHRRVGNPETEAEFLWSRSPLSRAKEISIPLLIAQGANDPRVKQAESEQIVAALQEAGIDHEYLLYPDEGHGFAKPENRLSFYAVAEAFLARHLGGRGELEEGTR